MLRNSIIGLLAFGVSAALAGFIWTAFEFPFAIVLPAAIGWYAVSRHDFGSRTALWAALVGGVGFTVAFLVAIFMALTDGSPVMLSAWAAAVIAAALAGGATGFLLGGARGMGIMAGVSAVGMLVATLAMGVLRSVAPESVDTAGMAQYLYFALAQGIVGAIVGVAVGAGTSWLPEHRTAATSDSGPKPIGTGTPHGV